MTTRETVTALTTIHRHNCRASRKILEWWCWEKGGTKQRQNIVLWWLSLGTGNQMCTLQWSYMSTAKICLCLSLMFCLREQPDNELHSGNGGSVTKSWMNSAVIACDYTFGKLLSTSTKQEYENYCFATHSVAGKMKLNKDQQRLRRHLCSHTALLSACSFSPSGVTSRYFLSLKKSPAVASLTCVCVCQCDTCWRLSPQRAGNQQCDLLLVAFYIQCQVWTWSPCTRRCSHLVDTNTACMVKTRGRTLHGWFYLWVCCSFKIQKYTKT